MKLIDELRRFAKEAYYVRTRVSELKRLGKVALFWIVVTEALLIAQVFPTKYFIDGLMAQRSSLYLTSIALLVLFLYVLGAYVSQKKMGVARNNFGQYLRTIIWAQSHAKELELSTDWHIAHGTGEKESIISKNVNRVETLLDQSIFNASPMVFRIAFTSAAIFFIGWSYGLLAIVTLLIYGLVLWINEPKIRPMRVEYRNQQRQLEIFGSELTASWRPIRSFGLEADFAGRNADLLDEYFRSETKRHALWRSYIIRLDYVVAFARFALLVLIIVNVSRLGVSAIGSVVLVMAWMERIYSNYYRLSDFQHELHAGLEALKDLLEIFLTVPTVRQTKDCVWPETINGRIEFENVSFVYHNGLTALSGINLKIEPNQIVAFIGTTGSGKTTLASLLQREFDPTGGRVLVDGVDLQRLDFNRYRQEVIGVVHQHPVLFNDTIANNIAIGRKGFINREDLNHACKQAYVDEFLHRWPSGLETVIGENGIQLSGGQRQRLSIARALYRKPKILILDEPTSALDPDSQMQVQRAIDELITRRESTIFVIAHRRSTYMNADLVVVLEDGKIAEMGTQAELAKLNGKFAHFTRLEMGGALV
jgi:ABC-type multidrug transport system fused ATPase/permease subunit